MLAAKSVFMCRSIELRIFKIFSKTSDFTFIQLRCTSLNLVIELLNHLVENTSKITLSMIILHGLEFLSADSFSFALQGGLWEMKMKMMKMMKRTVLYVWQ